MKFLKLIILILPVFFFSCNRDRNIIQPTPTYGIIDANLNGYTWAASSGYAQFQNFGLTLYGTANDGSSLTIYIYPYNGLGTYSANSPAQITFYNASGDQYNAISGSVNVNSETDQVQGSFYFTGIQNGGSTSIDMSGDFNLYY